MIAIRTVKYYYRNRLNSFFSLNYFVFAKQYLLPLANGVAFLSL